MVDVNLIAKALQKSSQFGNDYDIYYLRTLFERVQEMPEANRLFLRIAWVSDKEQLDDYFAEVVYALVFAGLGFQVEIEPFGGKGPDLRVSRDGRQALVEVTRFRKIYPGPPEFDIREENEELELPDYGDVHRDFRKSFQKLLSKFSQVGENQSIIAIWNDDGDLEEREVKTAVNALCNDAEQGILSIHTSSIIRPVWFSVGTYNRSQATLLFSAASSRSGRPNHVATRV